MNLEPEQLEAVNAKTAYHRYVDIEAFTTSPIERTAPYIKYLINAWPYYRSRLLAPGRAYDSDDVGMLAIGGSAHCDILDLEDYVDRQGGEAYAEFVNWTLDSSPEDVAYWRGFGRGHSPRSVRRNRDQLAADIAESLEGIEPH